MRNNKAKGLLWKIIPDTNRLPSYLFGTMHSGGKVATDKVDEVEPYLSQTSFYFGESDIDQLMSKPFQSNSPDWKGLRHLLSGPAYAKTARQFRSRFHLNLDEIQHLPPMMLSTLVSEKMLSAQSQEALDVRLWNLARHSGLSVSGLESVEEQIKIYEDIPLAFQVRQLKKMVLHLSGYAQYLLKIENAYQKNDLGALYRMTHQHLGKIKKVILYNRNVIMARRIADQVHHGSSASFFALGAAHLPGQQGILRLLRKTGLVLQPVCNKSRI